MLKIYALAAIAVLSGSLVGCATPASSNQAMLTYKTTPEGASLFEGNVNLGIAPQTRTYVGDGQNKTITTPVVTAVWPSGAKATFWTHLQAGDDRETDIQRPAKAAGLDLDLANAEKVRTSQLNKKQAENAEAAQDLRKNSNECLDKSKFMIGCK